MKNIFIHCGVCWANHKKQVPDVNSICRCRIRRARNWCCTRFSKMNKIQVLSVGERQRNKKNQLTARDGDHQHHHHHHHRIKAATNFYFQSNWLVLAGRSINSCVADMSISLCIRACVCETQCQDLTWTRLYSAHTIQNKLFGNKRAPRLR